MPMGKNVTRNIINIIIGDTILFSILPTKFHNLLGIFRIGLKK